MRILLLNTSFPPQARSAARLFFELGTCLVKRGHRVTAVTEFPWRRLGAEMASLPIPERERMNGMDVHRVRAGTFRENSILGRGINLLRVPIGFYQAARSTAPHDVALVYSPPLTLGLVAWMLKRRYGTPFAFNVQDIYPQTAIDLGYLKNSMFIRILEALEKFVYQKADQVVVHSMGNKSYLISRGRVMEEKVLTIPNWVDTDGIQPSERLNSFRSENNVGEEFLVCYAGTMGYAQDLNPIIRAAAQLRDRREILFLLVGEGVREAEWRAKTRSLPNVRFLPLLPEFRYAALVAACDAGFVPLSDNLRTPVVPAKLLDFMAAARPVIATVHPNSDTAAIIKDAQCGFALSPLESLRVTEAVSFLAQHSVAAGNMGINGRKYVEEHFSLSASVGRYEGLFSALCPPNGQFADGETSSAPLVLRSS